MLEPSLKKEFPNSRANDISGLTGMSYKEILRVRGNVKETYAKLSRVCAVVEDRFEKGIRERGLELLAVREGETVLEIGFGTGCSLVKMARSVGETGRAYGLDITPEMINLAGERLEKAGLKTRVELCEGDARGMLYKDNQFDAVYMAATLELFDTPDIPKVLAEIKRVLKPDGRLGLISMPKEGHEKSAALAIYEWLHRVLPRYASCRPIYVEDSLVEAGFEIMETEEVMLGKIFPMKIVIAQP